MALLTKKAKTTYSAQGTGHIPPPKTDTELGSASSTYIIDPVPALTNPQVAVRTFTKMTRDDTSVDVSLRAAKVPILGAEFFMEPFGDDQVDLDISEFCGFNIFDNGRPFLLVIEDILRFFEYGSSVLEKIWTTGTWAPKRSNANSKNYTLLKNLAVRPTPTIQKYNYDTNGSPLEVVQTAIDPKAGKADTVAIPIEKCLVFSNNMQGGDLRGKSLLRTAYSHWYYKTHFYKIDAIQKERHGIGVPKIKLPPNPSEADKAAARELGRNLRINEKAFIVEPFNFEVSFTKLEGHIVDVIASADHHNAMIMMNVMAQFLVLGIMSTGGGGRATSSSAADMFQKSLKYVANLICALFNMYLIPQLVFYNFDTNRLPKMRVRNIGETRDLQMLASAFANMLHEGGVSMNFVTENWFRNVFDMPLISQADYDAAQQAKADALAAKPSPFGNDNTTKNSSNGGTGRKGAAPSGPGGIA